ncbi:hypothetical protein M8J77_024504 [Diaphorina citri]|nr:hypothetical protein M8J77_024504 [Diaphorina citri]
MGAQQTKDRTLNAGINARSSTRHKPRNTKEFSHPITNIFTEHNGDLVQETKHTRALYPNVLPVYSEVNTLT